MMIAVKKEDVLAKNAGANDIQLGAVPQKA